MLINMLEAILKMLDSNEKMELLTFRARVESAKFMLAEIVNGLKSDEKPHEVIKLRSPIRVEPVTPEPKPEPKPEKPMPPGKKYKVVVDGAKRITKIIGLADDGVVILDGKKMTHKEAIGKTFNQVSLP